MTTDNEFMQLFIYRKGALYAADCSKCGTTNYTHEWVHNDHNERRNAMQAGALCCDDCGAPVAADTFIDCGKQYAGRYSAPGYLDCTVQPCGKSGIKRLPIGSPTTKGTA